MKKILCILLIMILIIIQGCVKDNEKFIDLKPERIEFISDKNSIVADGEDKAQFSYKVYGKDNMELKDRMVSIYLNGEEYKDKIFLTSTPGAYIFSAKAGEVKSSDLKIIATTQSATRIDLFLSKNQIADDNIDTVTISAIAYKDNKALKNIGIDYFVNGLKLDGSLFCSKDAGIYKIVAQYGDVLSTESSIEVIKKYKFMNPLVEQDVKSFSVFYGEIITQEMVDNINIYDFRPSLSIDTDDLGCGDIYNFKNLGILQFGNTNKTLHIKDMNFFRFKRLNEISISNVIFPEGIFEKKNEVMKNIKEWKIIHSYPYHICEDYFENMGNIKGFIWEDSYLDDTSFLKNLKVRELSLKNNKIKDITNIKYISWLHSLDLSNNEIHDISTLPMITETLILDNNIISDISRIKDIAYFNLSISLKNNKIKSIESLRGITSSALKLINFENNYIEDITPLESCKNVTVLNLKNNLIKDIGVLSKMEKLFELNLSGNEIDDISALTNLSSIVEVELEGTKIRDLSVLKKLIKLNYLNIKRTSKLDLSEGSEQLKIVKELEARGVIVGRD